MQLRALLQAGFIISTLPLTWAASSWGFDDATLSVQRKGAGVASGTKEKLVNRPIAFFIEALAPGMGSNRHD